MRDCIRRNAYGVALTLGVLALTLFGVDTQEVHGQPIVMVGGVVGGMATATFEMEEAMKVLFEDSLEVNVVTDSELLDLIEKDLNVKSEEGSDGRYVETAHLFGLPTGYGYRTESDPIPVPRGPQIANGRINLKKSLGSLSVTGDVFEKIRQGKPAFTTWAKEQMPLFARGIRNTKDVIMLGYGLGIRARVASVDAVNKFITVKDTLGVAGWGNPELQFMSNQDIAVGPNINGTGLRANAAAGNNYHVTNASFKQNRIYLSEVTNIAVGDYIWDADEHGVSAPTSAGVNREFMGLAGHVDDGGIVNVYFNIDRDSYDAWQATVVDISGAPYNGIFNDEAILYGDMQAGLAGAAKIDVIVAPYSGAFQFWRDLKNDRQLNDPRAWTGGSGRLYCRIRDRVVEVRSARKLSPQVAYGLTKGCFRRFTLGKFQWSTRTGSMWQQVIKDGKRYDAFWAYGYDHDEIFCREPNKNIRWEGLAPAQ
jgi:hypothetical protein